MSKLSLYGVNGDMEESFTTRKITQHPFLILSLTFNDP